MDIEGKVLGIDALTSINADIILAHVRLDKIKRCAVISHLVIDLYRVWLRSPCGEFELKFLVTDLDDLSLSKPCL